jgi:multiple sugar transport system permease protein
VDRVNDTIDLAPGNTDLGGQVVSKSRAARRSPPTARSRRKARTGALLVTPALALIAAFVLFPLGFAIYISLTDWPLIGPFHYIGFENYRELFHDPEFIHSVRFTITYTAIVTLPIFFLGYGLALLLRANRVGSRVFRTLFFLPFVVGLTTESFMFAIELQPGAGWVDWLLSNLGLASATQAWTVTHDRALLTISTIVVWFAAGLTMLILTGGMQGIPRELYEAADVDGASWLKKELRITLPLLRRSIALSLIISVIGSFLAFNQFFILAQNNSSLETVVEWVYQTAFTSYHLAYGTSMALLLVVVIGIVTLMQFLALRDDTDL